MPQDHEHALETMRLVNRFMTPYAVFLVLSGAVMAVNSERVVWMALAIAAVTSLLNMATLRLAAARPERLPKIRTVRLVANHFLNVWLIWLLLPYWPPIWMLFLLTMIAVGTYEGWRETIEQAALLGGLLAVVSYLRGVTGKTDWGIVGMQIATLACVGLFTNRLISQVRAENLGS